MTADGGFDIAGFLGFGKVNLLMFGILVYLILMTGLFDGATAGFDATSHEDVQFSIEGEGVIHAGEEIEFEAIENPFESSERYGLKIVLDLLVVDMYWGLVEVYVEAADVSGDFVYENRDWLPETGVMALFPIAFIYPVAISILTVLKELKKDLL